VFLDDESRIELMEFIGCVLNHFPFSKIIIVLYVKEVDVHEVFDDKGYFLVENEISNEFAM
jgi:hypothetical protein